MASAGVRIRTAREKKGWSQDDLAAKMGTSRQRVIGWEKHGEEPAQGNREKLAELFGGEPDTYRNPASTQIVMSADQLERFEAAVDRLVELAELLATIADRLAAPQDAAG